MIRSFTSVLPAVLVASVLFLASGKDATAQDRSFARTYQTNILPKGGVDVEFTNTARMGKKGDFSPFEYGRILDQRLEFEVGLGGNLQTSFYLNLSSSALLLKGGTEFEHAAALSFSNEWKWKLSDPSTDALGSALYGELTVGTDEVELEGKLILDKRFGKELLAFNLVGELELETEFEADENEVELEGETPVEVDLAYMHFFNSSVGLGLEVVNNNQIGEEGWEYSTLFAGPTLFIAHDKVFGALNILPQITNLHKTDEAPGDLVLDEHEKIEVRLLFGISF